MIHPTALRRITCRARWLTVVGIGLALIAGAGCERKPTEAHATPSAQKSQGPAPTPAGIMNVPATERLAIINDTALSTTDMELAVRELKQLTQAYGQTWTPLPVENNPSALDLHDLLNNLIDTELKAQDARARGLDRKTDLQRRLAYIERGFYAQEWERLQRDQAAPTEEEIHKFYEDNKAVFMDPERIHLRQIVTSTPADAEAARARVVQGTPFAQVAREVSVGAGKEAGGDVGWVLGALAKELLTRIGAAPTELTLFPQLEPVAFALETGQISQPVKGPDGRYYIVQLEERKPAKQKTELEVRDTINNALIAQHAQQQLEQLRRKAKIEPFADRLSAVEQ